MTILNLEDDDYCFVCGRQNPLGLNLNFSYNNNKVFAEFTLKKTYQGYKDIVHGGIIAAILDEAMIKAALFCGINAITAEITVRFKNPLMAGERATVEAEIVKHARRLIDAIAYIRGPGSETIAEGHGKLLTASLPSPSAS